ncbi:hypothetical protein B0T09DRAFT_94415 [Sordaria sp. MPI-SDFR-AT-0083]|nr:hypothetical protein B0T09DRAFT_94415 [Sordaria sp. MPI-SDFR-AT-0083]
MAEPERRPLRLRPQVSCALCRRRKVRCNRETPCSNCIRSRTSTAASIRSIRFRNLYHLHRKGHHVRSLLVILPPETVKPLQALSSRVPLSGRFQFPGHRFRFQVLSSRYHRFLHLQQADHQLLSRAVPRKLRLAPMPRV